MPIVRINGHLLYYCHVPKAVGSAVEAYLRAQFGPLAFADEQFYELSPPDRWTRSSPQHVDVESFERLFPADFFDDVFAVVRDPLPRLVSAYKFQKLVEGLIPPEASFDAWVLGLDRAMIGRRFAFDNHLLPMHRLVPEGTRIFRMESGLGAVIDYLRGRAATTGAFVNRSFTLSPPRAVSGFTKNKTRTKLAPSPGSDHMAKRGFLTNLVEFTAFGMLFGAVALWAVALAPIH
ncbi:sulfotransferase family 2 domain-containing protein [Methylorubrum salsuginis]|uniref:Sulfotransferase family protein n=2 Tax=Methylorubrum TaxID=2282523 RepID=A0A1I3ZZA6_9HYPH|nr:sulfotransferase family 2 domain-containing protein [Methylorubrum salsuginis]SFK49428.1 Sulfotransferase family protein [Methylorubrum salsuginis]